MEIRSNPPASYITLEEAEWENDWRPSLGFGSVVCVEGFTVQQALYFEPHVVKQFVEDLARMAENKTGSATLESMSPGQFQLVLKSQNKFEYLAASVTVRKVRPSMKLEVWGTFTVPSSVAAHLQEGFGALLSQFSE